MGKTTRTCTEPHTAFSGFIHRLRHHSIYSMKSTSQTSHLLKPLGDATETFINLLLQGYAFNPIECVLLSLSKKYGRMGLIKWEICQKEYEYSREITKETSNKVIRNVIQCQYNRISTANTVSNIKNEKKKLNNVKL